MPEIDLDGMVRDNRRICAQIELCAGAAMRLGDITAAQAYVLLQVLRHGEQGTSLTEIHRELGYSMAHLSATVKGLRKKDYVRVERCAGDDRRKIIFAAPRGEALRAELEEGACLVRRQLYGCFSRKELGELDRLQRKMLGNLTRLAQNRQQEVVTHEDCTA